MAHRTALEERLAGAMYDRSVEGLSRDDAPTWLALPADDRHAWVELARFAIDAGNELRDEDDADDRLEWEGELREVLEDRYRSQVDHWRRMAELFERQRDDATHRAAEQIAKLTAQLDAATRGADT